MLAPTKPASELPDSIHLSNRNRWMDEVTEVKQGISAHSESSLDLRLAQTSEGKKKVISVMAFTSRWTHLWTQLLLDSRPACIRLGPGCRCAAPS